MKKNYNVSLVKEFAVNKINSIAEGLNAEAFITLDNIINVFCAYEDFVRAKPSQEERVILRAVFNAGRFFGGAFMVPETVDVYSQLEEGDNYSLSSVYLDEIRWMWYYPSMSSSGVFTIASEWDEEEA